MQTTILQDEVLFSVVYLKKKKKKGPVQFVATIEMYFFLRNWLSDINPLHPTYLVSLLINVSIASVW